ncbi:MAG: NYN domain-containing protein [Candidatus Pacebacteria bacterium]|nr:NYN domain-containing protein [Candidatus Paceibacterota bacterium]
MKQQNTKNVAFIDGQNLHLGTKTASPSWRINLYKFRVYLKEKYKAEKVYYFLGVVDENYNKLYDEIQSAGFVLFFRKHNSNMLGEKKGNIDVDLVFTVMEKMYRGEIKDKIILVSGDGDYKILVDFLIKENKFEKILFPNFKKASSLYKKMTAKYFADLSNIDLVKKISDKKKKRP